MPKLTLRLSDELLARLTAAAEAHQRSLNGQIIWLLTKATDKSAPTDLD